MVVLALSLFYRGVVSFCIGFDDTLTIDFSEFVPGETNIVTPDYSVIAFDSNCPPDIAMIFDSSNPTGFDPDLGTPHGDFGGPGIGSGGAISGAGPNFRPEGNIIIVSEDGDSSDPDDCSAGGSLEISLTVAQEIDSIVLLDINNAVPQVTGLLGAQVVLSATVSPMGNNARTVVSMGDVNMDMIRIVFPNSGALVEIIPTTAVIACPCTSELDCAEGFGCSCSGMCSPCNILGGTHTIAGCDACQIGEGCCPPMTATAAATPSNPDDDCTNARRTSFTVTVL